MMKRYFALASLLAVSTIGAIAPKASAQAKEPIDVDVPFAGVVADACVVTPGLPGLLAVDGDGDTLTSEDTLGGVHGTVAVLCNGNFRIASADPEETTPAPFTPLGEITDPSSTVSKAIGGDVVAPEDEHLALIPQVFNVDMSVTKAGGVPAGAYTYVVPVTVTCL